MNLRAMRRKDRAMSQAEAVALLEKGEYGVLATVDKEACPYAVPLSYLYMDGKIYFHSALKGHKIDNINFNSKCCFTVVGETLPVYENDFSTYYESVMLFGRASLVEDYDEKYKALYELARKYLPDHLSKAEGEITAVFKATAVYSIEGEISGKGKRAKSK